MEKVTPEVVTSEVLTRRICLTIKPSLVGDHFLYSHDLNI